MDHYHLQELRKRESEWLESMDNLVDEIEGMGLPVNLPCRFVDIPAYAREDKMDIKEFKRIVTGDPLPASNIFI